MVYGHYWSMVINGQWSLMFDGHYWLRVMMVDGKLFSTYKFFEISN